MPRLLIGPFDAWCGRNGHGPFRSAAGKLLRSPGDPPMCGRLGTACGVRKAAIPLVRTCLSDEQGLHRAPYLPFIDTPTTTVGCETQCMQHFSVIVISIASFYKSHLFVSNELACATDKIFLHVHLHFNLLMLPIPLDRGLNGRLRYYFNQRIFILRVG